MKIGILTYHRAHNYGAYLQACALCNKLNEKEGIACEIIDYRMEKEEEFYSVKNISYKEKYFRPFRYRFRLSIADTFERAASDPIMVLTKERIVSDKTEDFVSFVRNKFDVIIAGSDEIWKTDSYRGFPNPYWLLEDLGCCKVSYAASSRSNFHALSDDIKKLLKDNLEGFAYIGVREKTTKDSMEQALGLNKEAHICCDPSFLYDFPVRTRSMSELLKGKARINPNKKNVVVMTNNGTLSRKIWKEFFLEYNLISVFMSHPGYINIADLSPIEWLEVIKNADIVLTTYFHGVCFSIINETPFVAFGSTARSSKIESLFEYENNFSERYVQDIESFIRNNDFKQYVVEMMKPVDSSTYVKQRREEFELFYQMLDSVKNGNTPR